MAELQKQAFWGGEPASVHGLPRGLGDYGWSGHTEKLWVGEVHRGIVKIWVSWDYWGSDPSPDLLNRNLYGQGSSGGLSTQEILGKAVDSPTLPVSTSLCPALSSSPISSSTVIKLLGGRCGQQHLTELSQSWGSWAGDRCHLAALAPRWGSFLQSRPRALMPPRLGTQQGSRDRGMRMGPAQGNRLYSLQQGTNLMHMSLLILLTVYVFTWN